MSDKKDAFIKSLEKNLPADHKNEALEKEIALKKDINDDYKFS